MFCFKVERKLSISEVLVIQSRTGFGLAKTKPEHKNCSLFHLKQNLKSQVFQSWETFNISQYMKRVTQNKLILFLFTFSLKSVWQTFRNIFFSCLSVYLYSHIYSFLFLRYIKSTFDLQTTLVNLAIGKEHSLFTLFSLQVVLNV